MPSNFTPNYQLNQWEADDRVLRTDFNADNTKIDAALTAVNAAMSGKIGRMEVIYIQEPDSPTVGGFFSFMPKINWDEWEYVCLLVYYPPEADQTLSPWIEMTGPGAEGTERKRFKDLSMSGYMLTFLPRHDGSQPTAGFVLANRFIPFIWKTISFQNLKYFQISLQGVTSFPTVVYFGGK